eukprot:TRINITY_DN2503_c0_g1_i1.p1 TRINITY_DN2503_c0_g1~~TRINITY_DN2503_c0_g1_i1.p1  ORF type:complete len:527 (+),score=48.65 TRINITY_DN2503_c0_g1_i1:72-1583(+)
MAPCTPKKVMSAFFILLLYAAFAYRTERSLGASPTPASESPQPQKMMVKTVVVPAGSSAVPQRMVKRASQQGANRQSSRSLGASSTPASESPQAPKQVKTVVMPAGSSAAPQRILKRASQQGASRQSSRPVASHPSSPPLASASTVTLQAPRRLEMYYKRGDYLNKGHYGKVFLAQELTGPHKGRTVVIKEVKASQYTPVEEEVMKMNLPFVADIIDKFEEGGVVSLVMRFYEQGDIYDYLSNEPGYKLHSTKKLKLWGSQMAYALWQLHRNEVLYGDLKLENTFVNKDGNVVLADFGISTHPCPAKAFTNKKEGTPGYVTESIKKRRYYGYEIDWWALGVALFTMEQGRYPYPLDKNPTLFKRDIKMHASAFVKSVLNQRTFQNFENDEARLLMVDKASKHPFLKHRYWHDSTDEQQIDEYWYGICKNYSLHKDKCRMVEGPLPSAAAHAQDAEDSGESESEDSEDEDDSDDDIECDGVECNPLGLFRIARDVFFRKRSSST